MSSPSTLAEQVAELVRREEQVRVRDPEGVHRARVACRRLRAVLPAYRRLLGRDVIEPLREDLRWLGSELGEARDRHVVHEILCQMLAQEPGDLVDDVVVRRVERTYGGAEQVPPALDSERHAALLSALEGLPDVHPEERDLRRRVRKDVERVLSRYDAVATTENRDAALHDVRKAAKRLRYAAEAWRTADGRDARRVAKAAKRLASHLGERQDTVVSRARILDLARAASTAGEPTFTYGRLHAREQQRAEALDAALPEVWRRFTGPATRSTC